MSRTPVVVLPRAEQDINAIADHIAAHNLNAALRFLDAIEDACMRLGQFPQSGALVKFESPRLHKLRTIPVPQFESYLIFHFADESAVTVVRVLHGAQHLEFLFRA